MKKFLKISGIIVGCFIIIILGFFIYLNYFFDLNTFQKTIKNKVYNVSKKRIFFKSATFSFKNGIAIKLQDLKVYNDDNKTLLFSANKGYINLKIKPLFYKKIKISKIILENGNLLLNFLPEKKNKNFKSDTNEKSNSFIIPQDFQLKKLILNNFEIHYIDSHLNIKGNNLFLKVENFSFGHEFPFYLKFNSLTGKNLKGKVKITGVFNFNNSFSPEKMHIKANVEATNLYAPQFYSYFVKQSGFKIFSGNIFYIKSSYEGDFKAHFKSNGIIKINNFKIKHSTFKKQINVNMLTFKYNYKMNGGHDIDLMKFNIDIDNKLNFSGLFTFKKSKVFLQANSKPFNVNLIFKYSPFNIKNLKLSNGVVLVKNFILDNTKIKADLNLKNIKGSFDKINFDNLSGYLNYSNKIINFKGNLRAEIKNFKLKDIFIKNFNSDFLIESSKIDLSNIKQSKINGFFNLISSINYKNYKNINIKINNAKMLGQNIITSVKIQYNNIPYLLNGEIGLNQFKFNVIINKFDTTFLKKFKIKKVENCKININISGNYKNIKLNSINGDFNNSEIIYDNYTFTNINGKIFCDNKSCKFNKLKLNFNGFNYILTGNVNNYLSKNISSSINIISDGIDSLILKNLKISDNSIKNCIVDANLFIKFKPKFFVKLKNASIQFINSNYHYKEFNIKNINGKVLINDSKLLIKDLSLKYNNIFYYLNGIIPDIYAKKKICRLNVKTDSIDREILKKLYINSNTLKNLDLRVALMVNISPEFKIKLDNGIIKFKNSKFSLIEPELTFDNLKGIFIIKKNNFYFKNFSAKFKNGIISFNGYFKKNYLNIKISGKNFNFSHKSKKTKEVGKKEQKKKNLKNKVTEIIKEIKKISEKIKGEIYFNFKNITLQANRLKDFSGKLKLYNKKLSLIQFRALTNLNGQILIKKFLFDFSKPESMFILNSSISKFDAADFTANKLSGEIKKCRINLYSNFKNPEKFLNNLDGNILFGIYNGYIHKFAILGNLFSVLNVSQIFKFKLPDITTKGLKYETILSKFTINKGNFITKNTALLSDSINIGFNGKINIVKEKINGEIVVQPLQTVGNIIGKIPFFGYIFGKKIILLYFKVNGKVNNPKIIPNPSKTFTKKTFDIFKNIFTLPKDILTNPEKILIPGMNK